MENKHKTLFITILLLLVALPTLASARRANILNKITMGYDKMIIEFKYPLQKNSIKYFYIKNRKSVRYVFDFYNANLSSPNLTRSLKYSYKIKSIRLSQYKKKIVRLVIETGKFYYLRYYIIDDNKLMIILPKGSSSIKGLFDSIDNSKISKKYKNEVAFSKKKSTKYSNSPWQNLPDVLKNTQLIKTPTIYLKKRYTVVLDPGHGGHDSGAVDSSKRYLEKVAILAIGLKARKYLQNMGFRVLMTRDSDKFVKLHQRTRFANFNHADIFVSIHANAVGRRSRASKAKGIETYFLSPARSKKARRVAAKENSIAFEKNYYTSMNTFLKTLTHSKIILSNKLAIDIQRNVLHNLRSRYKGVIDGGVRSAPFWVLVGAEMPAILIETGYITHPIEKRRLYDSKYQDLLAKGIAEGIVRFLANREREFE